MARPIPRLPPVTIASRRPLPPTCRPAGDRPRTIDHRIWVQIHRAQTLRTLSSWAKDDGAANAKSMTYDARARLRATRDVTPNHHGLAKPRTASSPLLRRVCVAPMKYRPARNHSSAPRGRGGDEQVFVRRSASPLSWHGHCNKRRGNRRGVETETQTERCW
jgi:hypothetical protein